MTSEGKGKDGWQNAVRNRQGERDGLREQILILEELSRTLDGYFELRTLGGNPPGE